MNLVFIRSHLERCLLSEGDLKNLDMENGYEDVWPVERAIPVE